MEREKFMKEARMTAHQILEGKENGIMNLVQRAWAEGKRNAEVETLWAAIDEALDRREPKAEPAEDAVYPTWGEWLMENDIIASTHNEDSPVYERANGTIVYLNNVIVSTLKMWQPIPADIAQKLGIEPKEGT